MTQRNFKSIMAMIAVGASMMVPGFAQAGAYGQNQLSLRSHDFTYGVTNVECQWMTDKHGNLYCAGQRQRQVNPNR